MKTIAFDRLCNMRNTQNNTSVVILIEHKVAESKKQRQFEMQFVRTLQMKTNKIPNAKTTSTLSNSGLRVKLS